MKSAGKARNNGLYRHIRTSKEIIRNLLNDYNIIILLNTNIAYRSKQSQVEHRYCHTENKWYLFRQSVTK